MHACTPQAIQQAIRAGVRCVEHSQLADEEAARMAAREGAWWSVQPFLGDEDAIPFPAGSANRRKQLENLSLAATPETSFVVIMKDGRLYKNLLSP